MDCADGMVVAARPRARRVVAIVNICRESVVD